MFATSSITQLPSSDPHVFAFNIRGHINDNENEALADFINDVFDRHEKVNMLMRLTDFTGSDWDAAFDWEVIKSRARSLSKVDRYAVVGAPDTAVAMIKAMNAIIPVEARAFKDGDEASAWDFVERGQATPV